MKILDLSAGNRAIWIQKNLEFAKEHHIPIRGYTALWDLYGKSAGPRRNRLMCEDNKDAIAVFFRGGRGTDNCYREAKEFGLTVIDLREV